MPDIATAPVGSGSHPEGQQQNPVDVVLQKSGQSGRLTNATVSFLTEDLETVVAFNPDCQALAPASHPKQHDQDCHSRYTLNFSCLLMFYKFHS